MKRLLLLLLGIALGAGATWWSINRAAAPDPRTGIAAASLDAIRAQNRLTVFAGRFTVAVSTRIERMGLVAEKTMIVPATVRYEIDCARLGADDAVWDAEARVLTVRLPDIELAEPEVDLAGLREYSSSGLLMAVTDAESVIDRANRAKIRDAVMKEADTRLIRDLARGAARSAVTQGFSLPLAAAGLDARVIVRFPDESGFGL
jgi:hypothetical protein